MTNEKQLDIRDELDRQSSIVEFLAQTLAAEIDYPRAARQGLVQVLVGIGSSLERINEGMKSERFTDEV